MLLLFAAIHPMPVTVVLLNMASHNSRTNLVD